MLSFVLLTIAPSRMFQA